MNMRKTSWICSGDLIRNMKSVVIFVFGLCCFSLQDTFAATASLSTKISHHYDSMRALGMGNAFTAVADDYSLIFYNPAGFANKKVNEVQFSLLGAGVSSKTTKLIDDISKASKTEGTEAQKSEAISTVLEEYYGKALGGKVQALEMFWIRKNWGVALIPVDLTIDMSIDRQLGPAIDLNVKGDTTLAYGMGKSIGKYLSAGVTAKYVHRVSVEQSVSALELATDSNVLSSKRFKEGQLIDFDLGILWTPNWFGQRTEKIEENKSKAEAGAGLKVDSVAEKNEKTEKKDSESEQSESAKAKDSSAKEVVKDNLPLTLGVTIHSLLGGSFSKTKMVNKDAEDAPTKIHRVVDLGAQYVIVGWRDFTIRTALDFRDLGHPEVNFNKSVHAGLEFDYTPSGWFKTQLRGGINQMYYTAGATFLFGVLQIDAVTFGEEVGTTSKKIENRVYAAKVGFNF